MDTMLPAVSGVLTGAGLHAIALPIAGQPHSWVHVSVGTIKIPIALLVGAAFGFYHKRRFAREGRHDIEEEIVRDLVASVLGSSTTAALIDKRSANSMLPTLGGLAVFVLVHVYSRRNAIKRWIRDWIESD